MLTKAMCKIGIGLFLVSSANIANAQVCEDTSPVGDGWGWDGSQSCRVQSGITNTQTNSSNCVDTNPIGDGWGWDGSSSCRVGETTITTTVVTTTTTTVSDSCVDTSPIGDGWGWDGSSSCVVGTSPPPITNQRTCVDTPPLNDGWGWDGANSCQVTHIPIDESISQFTPSRVSIPYVSTPPSIDGNVDFSGEWSAAVAQDIDGNTTWIDNLIVRENNGYNDYGPTSRWYAMHDGNYLYLLIRNTEDQTVAEESNDSNRAYQDDSIELFFDGNNSRRSGYDGQDDYHLILRYADIYNYNWGSEGSLQNLNFYYSTNYSTHYSGDVFYEIAIDIASAGLSQNGRPFGFEIQINEDDDGGGRDAKWSWAERTGEHRAWYDPSAFGSAVLE